MTTDQPTQGISLGIVIDLAPGLDGQIWPRLQFINGVTSYIFTVPLPVFEQFLRQIADKGREAVIEAKRANSPLKVSKDMPRTSPFKEHRR